MSWTCNKIREFPCPDCGVQITTKNRKKKRCGHCAAEDKKRRDRERAAAKSAARKPISSPGRDSTGETYE